MAEKKNKSSVFLGVLDAVNSNRRKKTTIDVENPNYRTTQSMPNIDSSGGVENMQQQFLDWQVTKIAHDLYTRTVYYDTDRISAYQDFRAMDGSPEIAAALNIIRDECVAGNSVIPLLDGTKKTIEELYKSNYKNFYVYSYNTEKKQYEAGLCERVAYKGKQDVYRVIFDDDSYIDATSEHLWLLKGKNEYLKTSDLKANVSIESFYTQISTEKEEMKGYEMILENGEWKYTHRIINRNSKSNKKDVIHHKDFNKRNNVPSNLKIMNWGTYQESYQKSNRQENNKSFNHTIKDVVLIGKEKTYDLVNVRERHNFAILTSNGTGVISHNCLTRSERGNILEIYSENSRVKEVIQDLFYNVLSVEFNLRLWIRDLLKYGDYFVMLQIDKDVGIYDFLTLPSEEVHREEGFDGRVDSVRFRWETTGDYFEEWQVAHFRLLEDSRKLPYGRSILDSSRKLWKQLQLAEDAMLVYRITRAPERRIFYVEVGNLPDQDVKTYMGKVQKQIKKQPIVNQKNGDMSYKYNPENVTEDYWVPIRGDKSSRIETLPGASNLGDIQDIEYLQNKLFAALQVPKTYLNFAEGLQGGSTLSQADLRFARTINSIQEAVLLELRRIANVHLYFLGFEDDIDNFTLTLTNPSTQQELLKLETMKSRLEVFKEFFTSEATSPSSYTWAMENILGFSKSDIKLILKQKKIEKKMFAEIESAVESYRKIGLFDDLDERYEDPEAVAALAANGGGGNSGDESSDLGGGSLGGGSFGGGDFDMGGEESGGEEAGGEESGGEEAGGEEAISEVKAKNKYLISEKKISNLVNELLDSNKNKTKFIQEKRNVLFNNSKKLTNNTKKLIESIDKNLKRVDIPDAKYDIITHKENALLESNEENIKNTKEIFDKLDELTNLESNE